MTPACVMFFEVLDLDRLQIAEDIFKVVYYGHPM